MLCIGMFFEECRFIDMIFVMVKLLFMFLCNGEVFGEILLRDFRFIGLVVF